MSRRFLPALLVGCLFAGVALAEEPFPERPANAALIRQLRRGGFVLYMRHGTTDVSRPDRTPTVDLADCATQRPLTEAGRQLAAAVGAAMRQARIPLGEVYASPFCRTRESAAAAFGKGFQVDHDLMYSSNLTSAEKAPFLAETRRLLSTQPAARSNRVLVAHATNLMDLIGLFPKPEGSVIVFKPLGKGNMKYLASIAPEAWAELIEAAR